MTKLQWPAKMCRAIGHHVGEIWILYAILAFLGLVLPKSDLTTGFILAGAVLIVVAALGFVGLFIHDKMGDCAYCTQHAPEDGKATARGWRRAAFFSHHHQKFMLGVLVANVAFIVVSVFALPAPWSYLYLFTNGFYIWYVSWSTKWHLRLRPWCPLCEEERRWLEDFNRVLDSYRTGDES